MDDRACPIGDCTDTVEFENDVVEVTPRFRLHDLRGVDEFAACPSCDAEVAGFYEEESEDGDVELILDIDDEGDGGESGGDASTDGESAAGDADAADAADGASATDGSGDAGEGETSVEDPHDVLADATPDEDYEPVFGDPDDE